MERRNAWLSYTEAEEKELESVAKAYRNFLDLGKTERECITQIVKEAEAAGYESLEAKIAKGESLKAGDKVLIIDDLLATGGTAVAACNLVKKVGAEPVAAAFIIELNPLKGRAKIEAAGVKVVSMLDYDLD